MNEILEIIKLNMMQVGVASAILFSAYLSNVVLSLYDNITISKELFDKQKLLNGTIKFLTFLVGGILLIVSISLCGSFLVEFTGMKFEEGFSEVVSIAVIVSALGTSTVYYLKDAIETFVSIIHSGIKK